MRIIALIVLCLALLAPLASRAADATKDPLNYPLRQYGLMLGIALFGGLVSWFAKVRKGELAAWNVMQLVGELCTSAFSGLVAFWMCEYLSSPPVLTAALVGVAGHMGTRAIQLFESAAQKRWAPLTSDSTPKDPQ